MCKKYIEPAAAVAKNKHFLYFLLVTFIFLLTGLDHDPWWKKGEAYSFGLIYHFYKTGTWLIPTNAGVPFMEKPPLYYWTGTIMCKLFGSWIPLHDAARLPSVLYMGITILFLFLSGQAIFSLQPDRQSLLSRTSVFLFLGTYGTSLYGHSMSTDLALLAGTTVTLYGLILLCKLPEQWKCAGISIGTGIGMVFLSKGLVLPVILSISGLCMSLLSPRFRWQEQTVKGTALACAVALPFFIIWPVLVYQYSPALFHEWFWDNNIGRFLGSSVAKLGAENHRLNLIYMLPVFGFPIFPLACFEVFRSRHEWQRTEYLLPLIISVVGIGVLLLSASFRTIYILPLFPGFCLLAAQGLMRLPPAFLSRWNGFVRIAFSIAGLGVWIIWWNILHPLGTRPFPWLIHWFDSLLAPDFIPEGSQTITCFVALTVAAFWVLSFQLKGNSPLASARIFFMGSVLMWCTTHTLLMPWINETKSFRSAVKSFEDYRDLSPYANECVANYQLGENMAPMLEYFMHRDTPLPTIDLNEKLCPLFLTFTLRDAPVEIDPRWKMVWHGTRLRDIRDSELRLYERVK